MLLIAGILQKTVPGGTENGGIQAKFPKRQKRQSPQSFQDSRSPHSPPAAGRQNDKYIFYYTATETIFQVLSNRREVEYQGH